MMHALVHRHARCEPQEWFNEGLASFYEMASLDHGRITAGFTNWRQPILRAAIRSGKVTRLRALLQKTTLGAADLALARFLFVYLWLHGANVPFARTYLETHCPKARGAALGTLAAGTLETLLGRSLHDIERDLFARALELDANLKLTPLAKSATTSRDGD